MERLQKLLIAGLGVCVESVERKANRTDQRRKATGVDRSDIVVVFLPRHRPELNDIARPEEDHEVAQVTDFLLRIVNRHRRDAKKLIAPSTANRIDTTETASVADCQPRRIRARA